MKPYQHFILMWGRQPLNFLGISRNCGYAVDRCFVPAVVERFIPNLGHIIRHITCGPNFPQPHFVRFRIKTTLQRLMNLGTRLGRNLGNMTNFHTFPSKWRTFTFLTEVTKWRRWLRLHTLRRNSDPSITPIRLCAFFLCTVYVASRHKSYSSKRK